MAPRTLPLGSRNWKPSGLVTRARPSEGAGAGGSVGRTFRHVPRDPRLVPGDGEPVHVEEDALVVLAEVALQDRLVVAGDVEGEAEARGHGGLRVDGVGAGGAAADVVEADARVECEAVAGVPAILRIQRLASVAAGAVVAVTVRLVRLSARVVVVRVVEVAVAVAHLAAL